MVGFLRVFVLFSSAFFDVMGFRGARCLEPHKLSLRPLFCLVCQWLRFHRHDQPRVISFA